MQPQEPVYGPEYDDEIDAYDYWQAVSEAVAQRDAEAAMAKEEPIVFAADDDFPF